MSMTALESMIGNIFGERKYTISFEDVSTITGDSESDLNNTDGEVMEIAQDAEDTIAEIEKEQEDAPEPIDNGEGGISEIDTDPSITEKISTDEATESMHKYLREALEAQLLLRTAEKFIWSSESDEEDIEIDPTLASGESYTISEESKEASKNTTKEGFWAKFWDAIKRIYEKIRLVVTNFFKRIGIFLAGSMKKYSEWYRVEGSKYESAIVKSDVTKKILLPSVNFSTYEKSVKKDVVDTLTKVDKATVELEKASTKSTKLFGLIKVADYAKYADECRAASDKITVDTLRTNLYGKDSKASTVTAKDFFSKFDFKQLKSSEAVKEYYNKSKELVATASKNIKTAMKAKAVKESDVRKALKITASGLQVALNNTTTGLIWLTTDHIKLLSISLQYGRKIVKNLSGENKLQVNVKHKIGG